MLFRSTTLTVIYLYLIPARIGGEWNLNIGLPGPGTKPSTLRFDQKPEGVTGSVEIGGSRVPLRDLRIAGEDISFTLNAGGSQLTLRGSVRGTMMSGNVLPSGAAQTWSASKK